MTIVSETYWMLANVRSLTDSNCAWLTLHRWGFTSVCRDSC